MRRPIIAGNWKMNNTAKEGAALIEAIKPLVADANCDVVVCVPAIDIPAAAEALKGSNISLGAQNVHFAPKGAYTGEISADMLKEYGVEYVIIGPQRTPSVLRRDGRDRQQAHACSAFRGPYPHRLHRRDA